LKSGDTVGLRLASLETDARFPGGEPAWNDYIISQVKNTVAIDSKAPYGTYTVAVRFIIGKDGYVIDVVAETKHGYGMEAELIMAIKRSPKWIPAMNGGKAAIAFRRQELRFEVN
jgi:protein TonB